MGCGQALNYLEDMSLHAARGGEHVTIELSCRTCPYTPRGVAGKQGSHGKGHEREKENNNEITNEIDIEKGNIRIAMQNMPLHAARGGGHKNVSHARMQHKNERDRGSQKGYSTSKSCQLNLHGLRACLKLFRGHVPTRR